MASEDHLNEYNRLLDRLWNRTGGELAVPEQPMILVTGATGFVGCHLVRAIVQKYPGHGMRTMDVRPHTGPIVPGVESHTGSIESESDVRAALRGVDVVVHLAAFVDPSSQDLERMVRVNESGTATLAASAVASGCRHFIHISSAGIYGLPRGLAPLKEVDTARPMSPYQRTKWAAEVVLQRVPAGLTTVNILRPTGIYGAGSKLELPRYRRVLKRRWSIGLQGELLVNPVHVRDLVTAILALIDDPAPHRTVFNLGGERPIKIGELDALVARALGVSHHRIVIPSSIARPFSRIFQPVSGLLGCDEALRYAYARGENASMVVDDSAFQSRYPQVPRVPIAEGIREHVSWARAEGLL